MTLILKRIYFLELIRWERMKLRILFSITISLSPLIIVIEGRYQGTKAILGNPSWGGRYCFFLGVVVIRRKLCLSGCLLNTALEESWLLEGMICLIFLLSVDEWYYAVIHMATHTRLLLLSCIMINHDWLPFHINSIRLLARHSRNTTGSSVLRGNPCSSAKCVIWRCIW